MLRGALGKTPANFRSLAAQAAFWARDKGRAVSPAHPRAQEGPRAGPRRPGTHWHGRSAASVRFNSCPRFARQDKQNPEAGVSLFPQHLYVFKGLHAGGHRGRRGGGGRPGTRVVVCCSSSAPEAETPHPHPSGDTTTEPPRGDRSWDPAVCCARFLPAAGLSLIDVTPACLRDGRPQATWESQKNENNPHRRGKKDAS